MNSDWWLNHGLDGVIGGLIGALVTGFAVWLTLRHERQQGEHLFLREAVGRCLGASTNLAHMLTWSVGSANDIRDTFMEVGSAGWLAYANTGRKNEEMGLILRALLIRLAAAIGDAMYYEEGAGYDSAAYEAAVNATAIANLFIEWLWKPEDFETKRRDLDSLLAEAREATTEYEPPDHSSAPSGTDEGEMNA